MATRKKTTRKKAPKDRLSEAGRRRISLAAKRRWREYRAAKAEAAARAERKGSRRKGTSTRRANVKKAQAKRARKAVRKARR